MAGCYHFCKASADCRTDTFFGGVLVDSVLACEVCVESVLVPVCTVQGVPVVWAEGG